MPILDFFQNNKLRRYDSHRAASKVKLVDLYNGLYQEPYFCELLSMERKRSERSRRPFLLMLLDLHHVEDEFEKHAVAKKIGDVLQSVTRDTDIKGWYKYGEIIGVTFTEITANEKSPKPLQKELVDKCMRALETELDTNELGQIAVTWHVFPGKFEKVFSEENEHTKIYPDVRARIERKKLALFIKRTIDIFCSLFVLVFFSPIFFGIAMLIKLTSQGPVFFRQERIGLLGKKFMFFKFRSMYVDNDPSIHKEFVKSLIHGQQSRTGGKKGPVKSNTYKITSDPRVTPAGQFLRKTSLDELPQFFNVLKGQMSLVGPRPPIPYEYVEYDVWHRKRLVEMKPGITGLWQVKGRSSTTFDDMVRMDLQYIKEWSLWMDMRILLKTPWVALKGKGAY